MERETGIEPALVAWKATVLPLNYSRPGILQTASKCSESEKSGGGRWITPGILPSAPPGPAFGCSKSLQAILSNRHFIFSGSHPPPINADHLNELGGGRWIRTTEGMSQQIYSLPPLAAWVSLRNSVQSPTPTSACAGQNGVQRTPGMPAWQSLCTEPRIVRSQPYPCQGAMRGARQVSADAPRRGSGRSRWRYSCPIP